jgi:hypothetical protein
MIQMNLQWDASTRELLFAIPPTWSADACVLFSGREVKRVEFCDRNAGASPLAAWDSCNGPSVAHPTPIAGGYTPFDNPGSDPRELVVRALHSGGISCYMEHGPATLAFLGTPDITPRAICLGVEAVTARFTLDEQDSIEVVLVIRSEVQSTGSARDLTEAIVRELLRERMEGGGMERWRRVA